MLLAIKFGTVFGVLAVVVLAILIIVFVLVQKNSNAKTARQQTEKKYIEEVSANLRNAMQTAHSPEWKTRISEVLDFVSASPVRSTEAVAELERNAVIASQELFGAVAAGDEAEIAECLEEVRRICAMRNNAL